jgi:hypothetical protein
LFEKSLFHSNLNYHGNSPSGLVEEILSYKSEDKPAGGTEEAGEAD